VVGEDTDHGYKKNPANPIILKILIQTKKSPHSFNPQNQIGCRFSPSFGGEGEAKTSEYEHLIRGQA
jgi:hypothetical protein